MRAVVTADTHLSISDRYIPFESERLGVRREQFYEAFDAVVDHAIEIDADFFFHSGDLFDVAEPATEYVVRVIRRIRDLEESGVAPVFVPGNHDASRVVDGREVTDPHTATPLDVLDAAGRGTVFLDTDRGSSRIFERDGETVQVIGLGYDPSFDGRNSGGVDPLTDLDVGRVDADHSVLLTHHCIDGHDGGLDGWPHVRHETIAELDVDVVCSGHVHEHTHLDVGDTDVIVPGATERRSFGEASNRPGFYTVEIPDSDGETVVERAEIDTAPMFDWSVSAGDLPEGGETERLCAKIEEAVDGDTLLRLSLVDPDDRVDTEKLEEVGQSAFFFQLVPDATRDFS